MGTIADLVAGRPMFFAKAEWTVKETARYMTEKNVGAVPVLQGDRLVGIFSERDLMSRVVVPGKDPEKIAVREVMTRDLVVAHCEDDAQTCLQKMQKAKCRHLPVVSGERLIGTLSLRELMQVDLAEKVVEIRAMADYIRYTPQDFSLS